MLVGNERSAVEVHSRSTLQICTPGPNCKCNTLQFVTPRCNVGFKFFPLFLQIDFALCSSAQMQGYWMERAPSWILYYLLRPCDPCISAIKKCPNFLFGQTEQWEIQCPNFLTRLFCDGKRDGKKRDWGIGYSSKWITHRYWIYSANNQEICVWVQGWRTWPNIKKN